ncbi:ribonuclease kappa-B-like [Anneissia japonica]|uniref:ribonuclease kappa-B-like n=1 Tax=Anneissia japonica TaxID=1529436 RepID=UPI00142571DE|nr:ribonuclease kappa-B-like [Anneissia japonica]
MVKFCGPKLSTCCLILSVWGIVMLLLLGVFFEINAVTFIEDVTMPELKPGEHLTKSMLEEAYHKVAVNCFIAAALYGVTFFVSAHQFYTNRRPQYQVN